MKAIEPIDEIVSIQNSNKLSILGCLYVSEWGKGFVFNIGIDTLSKSHYLLLPVLFILIIGCFLFFVCIYF